ncbi:DUF2231 domain-containing protein [Sphaerisporangium sp. TRM90804]|uniref:DUF2231 domain-containing protein n=1 Tax=Sphaerisporangium sp. TRM90804 TaxID=3031113 RepID=UPI00244C1EAE|nr:DUF2231 domain-containing protein [Sphaerisporangium sp. TRM90804]MDH2427400.1 hypothetical protein [Sphaerisporangium sp. TRM90804]
MFEQILGLPAHPLIVHAAVIFIPLLAVGSVVYGLVPRVRPRLGWAVTLLALAAPAAAFAAEQSGEAFKAHTFAGGLPEGELGMRIAEHEGYAGPLLYSTIGLGASALALVYSSLRLGKVTTTLLTVVTVVLALVAGFYAVRSGHSGAVAVWG